MAGNTSKKNIEKPTQNNTQQVVESVKIDQLTPDAKNFNKGTSFGQSIIQKSLKEFGAGRSVLLDKDGKLIAGNKTVQNAAELGFKDVIVVKTDGKQLVAVQRTDIKLDSKKGRELALADNATSKANLSWDEEALAKVSAQWDFAPVDWGVAPVDWGDKNKDNQKSIGIDERFIVEVEVENEAEQESLFNELKKEGYKCRILTL